MLWKNVTGIGFSRKSYRINIKLLNAYCRTNAGQIVKNWPGHSKPVLSVLYGKTLRHIGTRD